MKRAQITMFVIIGIVLLLGAGLFFFISTELREDKPVVDVPDVSLETRPATQLIESCLESTAQIAIEKVSAQGGYMIAPNPHPLPWEGSSVIVNPYQVAYWRYMTEDNCDSPFGCPASERPPLCKTSSSARCNGLAYGSDSIEEHVENYVLENIGDCIDNLVSLSDFYDVEISDERELEVFFNNGETVFVLTNPLLATSRSTDNTKSVEQFRAVLDVDMLEMYDIATKTLNQIQAYNPYEYQTLNLISVYTCDDNDCLPPMGELSLSLSSSHFWVQESVKERLETEILPLMSFVTFNNFDNAKVLQRPEGENFDDYNGFVDGFYGSFSKKISDEPFYGYELNNVYTYAPIKFQIDDGKQLIKPKKVDTSQLGFGAKLLPIGFQDMRFNYFINYPIVLQLRDPDAFNGKGLDFNFAVEVSVVANKPAYEGVEIVNTASSVSSIALDDYENMVDRTITINSFDAYTDQALDDVVISYYCLDDFEIGVTSMNAQQVATLSTRLPHCEYGGFLIASRNGYARDVVAFNNPEGAADQTLSVSLWPLKEKEVIVYKRSPQNIINVFENNLFGIEQEFSAFDSHETVMVSLEKEKNSPFEENIPPIGFGIVDDHFNYDTLNDILNSPQQRDIIEQAVAEGSLSRQEADGLLDLLSSTDIGSAELAEYQAQPINMSFVPGVYNLELTMLKYGYTDDQGTYVYALDVPAHTIPGNSGFLGIGDTPDVELDAVQLSTWVNGGGTARISLSPELVYESADPLIFYALEIPTPTHWNCDYLPATNPGASSCNELGYCGEYVPEDPNRYCVQFETYQDIEEYGEDKRFMITQGLVI